jgi:hypothetical protein
MIYFYIGPGFKKAWFNIKVNHRMPGSI